MSANALQPAFAIPKLLELQGNTLSGEGANFWASSYKSSGTLEDIQMFLEALHPMLMGLNMAGYDVQHVLMAMYNSSVLDINLRAMRYRIQSNLPILSGISQWYTLTGLEWENSESTSTPTNFLPEDTLIAVSCIAEPRNRPQTGRSTYAIDLQAVLFEETNNTTGDTAFIVTTVPSSDPLLSAFTLYLVKTLDDITSPGIYAMSDLLQRLQGALFMAWFRLQETISERWLAIDGNPVGLLDILSPDDVADTLAGSPLGKPNQWGCEQHLGDTTTLIVDECRGVWQYLQSLSPTVVYTNITSDEARDLLKDTRAYLKDRGDLKFSIVPSISRTLRFAQTIRTKMIENTGFSVQSSLVKQFTKLPWAELLMLLHNLYVIDILSGVTVTESMPIRANYPDVTGFYESVNGDITVQINQAGSYTWGFMQERVPTEVVVDPYLPESYMLNEIGYYRIDGATVYYDDPDNPPVTPAVAFTITGEEISITDEAFILEWTLSTNEVYTLVRYMEVPVLPNEMLDGLPVDDQGNFPPSVQAYRLTQRAPLSPWDDSVLDNAVSVITAYLQEYHRSTLPSWPSQMDTWLQELKDALQAYVVVDEVLTVFRTNDQFPLLNYILRVKLQSQPLALTPTDTRSLYLALLELIEARGASSLKALDTFILLVTGITIDEAIAILADKATEALADGDFTYRFRTISVGGGLAWHIAASLSLTFVNIQRIDDQENVLWSGYWAGIFEGFGVGYGGKFELDVKKMLDEVLKGLVPSFGADWTKLYAKTLWEPADFSGLMTIAAVEASVAYWVGVKFNIMSRTTFFELTKGLEWGYGRLVAGNNFKSVWDVLKTTFYGIFKGNFDIAKASASITATLTYGNLLQVPFTGNVNVSGYFEPMQESSSYISPVPLLDTQNVHFAVGSAALTSAGESILTLLVAKLRPYFINPQTYLEIHGFASPSGGDAFNLQLSDDRAQVVYDYLFSLLGDVFAVPTHHTIVIGHGEWDARYLDGIENGSEVAEWRRVDVVVNGVVVCSIFGEKGGF